MQITIGNRCAFIHPSLLNMYLLPRALIFSSSEWNLCWGICCHNLYCHCSHSINGRGKNTNTHTAFHLPLHWGSGTFNCVYTLWWELKPPPWIRKNTHWFRLTPLKAHTLFTKEWNLNFTWTHAPDFLSDWIIVIWGVSVWYCLHLSSSHSLIGHISTCPCSQT